MTPPLTVEALLQAIDDCLSDQTRNYVLGVAASNTRAAALSPPDTVGDGMQWKIPSGNALTVTMAADAGDKTAERDLAMLSKNNVTNIMRNGTEAYFHRLRLAVAEQPELASRISVFLLNADGTCTPIGLTKDDELRWPSGFLREQWDLERKIQLARKAK